MLERTSGVSPVTFFFRDFHPSHPSSPTYPLVRHPSPTAFFSSSGLGKLFRLTIKCIGAEWIYDTDDDNVPLRQSLPLQNQLLEMNINQEQKGNQTTFNIYKQVT